MKCFLWEEKKFFVVNRKEEITDNVFLITDYEESKIKETLESGGHLWTEGKEIKWSGPKPSRIYDWDKEGKQWTVNQDLYKKALEDLRALLWESIKAYRLFKSTDGTLIPSINKWAHTDEVSQVTYSRAKDYLELNPDATIDWKMMCGNFVKVDSALLKEICSKVFQVGQEAFTAAEVHRRKVYSIEDLEELSEYDYKTNWPQTYSDVKGE
jgi:hypothetical protein